MAKYAVIDVGTHSIKCLLAEKDAAGKWSVVFDWAEISRLGAGLAATGELTPAAMERTLQAIADMRQRLQADGVAQTAIVGTMGLRAAQNAPDFVRRVQAECGVALEILAGAEEARLAYLAVTAESGFTQERRLVFDTGGGSTEFIVGRHTQIDARFSLNVGAVRYTEQFLRSDPVTQAELRQAVTAIAQDLAELRLSGKIETLIGIGGGVTTLSAVKQQLAVYDPARIQGARLELSEIERQLELYQAKTLVERKQIVGLQPERADVILAGTAIVREIMRKVGLATLTVSDRGLRHGVLVDRFNDQHQGL